MDLTWSAADMAFRDEVRGFLDDKLTPELRRAGRLMTSVYADHEASMEWQRILHERAGRRRRGRSSTAAATGASPSTTSSAGSPSSRARPRCLRWASGWSRTRSSPSAPTAQKEYFLPRILTGEVFFCQGYSEPEAGSDLAALSMAAVDDGDDLVCTGSKIWTTHAGEANWMFALVRTSKARRSSRASRSCSST